jgi:DNA-binding transcriptional LysR family regulator
MAATGRFVSTMPKSAFDYAAKRYGLEIIPIRIAAPRWPLAAVTLRNRNLSPVIDLFLKCTREVARSKANL